jgi:hypothetical protein
MLTTVSGTVSGQLRQVSLYYNSLFISSCQFMSWLSLCPLVYSWCIGPQPYGLYLTHLVCMSVNHGPTLCSWPHSHCHCWDVSSRLKTRSAQIFQKFSSHLKILGLRRVTWSMFHPDDPQMLGATTKFHCTTSRKVAVWIPNGVFRILHWHNPSCRAMALGLTQPVSEMSMRNIS